MSILAWIVLGLVAGFISSLIVNRSGQGFFLDIVLGLVGAVVGGWIMAAIGGEGSAGSTCTACSSRSAGRSSCW
jgi:uncharacterized membrane protein YeaQ/YmgE (transglycosylase-associated protein family)